jgi:hypothetical protein
MDFAMLRPGARVAVAVSGGKDSLCLLDARVAHRRRTPFPYDLVAAVVRALIVAGPRPMNGRASVVATSALGVRGFSAPAVLGIPALLQPM